MKPRLITTLALLLLTAALVGACGSSGSNSGGDVAANQPSGEAASEDQPDTEETQAAKEEEGTVSCLEAPPSKTKFTVAARDDTQAFSFRPRKLEAPQGQEITIVYINKAEGPEPHNLTIDSLACGTGQVDKASITFTMPSEVTEFHCTFHPFMTGKLVPTA